MRESKRERERESGRERKRERERETARERESLGTSPRGGARNLLGNSRGAASERRGSNIKRFKEFFLKTKAIIWP